MKYLSIAMEYLSTALSLFSIALFSLSIASQSISIFIPQPLYHQKPLKSRNSSTKITDRLFSRESRTETCLCCLSLRNQVLKKSSTSTPASKASQTRNPDGRLLIHNSTPGARVAEALQPPRPERRDAGRPCHARCLRTPPRIKNRPTARPHH